MKEKVYMIDFHGTLMVSEGQIKKESLLSFYPVRKTVGFMSGFRWFVRFSNSKLYPNYNLIERLNRLGQDSSIKIYIVSAACESSRSIMEEELKKIGLTNFSGLILRKDFFQSHTDYKVEMAGKLSADVVVEDCFHYGRAIKEAFPHILVRCPNWHSKLA